MVSAVSDFFTNIMTYVNILFENELVIGLSGLMIASGMIGLFGKLLKINR